MDILEATIKYKDGFVTRVEVLVQDGTNFKAYAATTAPRAGYYYLDKVTRISHDVFMNTAKYGFKIDPSLHFDLGELTINKN